jgi:hypothetical protein
MAELVRHRQTKGSATDRLHLNHRATPRLHNVVLGEHGAEHFGAVVVFSQGRKIDPTDVEICAMERKIGAARK